MNNLDRVRCARLQRLLVLLFGLLASARVALAHLADVYLQATCITVAPTQIVVELNLTPGVLVAPEVLSVLDADGDEQIADAEGQAYWACGWFGNAGLSSVVARIVTTCIIPITRTIMIMTTSTKRVQYTTITIMNTNTVMHSHAFSRHHGDGYVHTQLPPADGLNLRNLLAMGVFGGLVPCPEALGIMVVAIGLIRILLGLGLIVSFSFGLAAVLIVIGILLVRSQALVERLGGLDSRWSSALPLASAVFVTGLGVGITLSGLATYLG